MNWAISFLSRVEVLSSKIVAKGRHTTSGTNSCMANKLFKDEMTHNDFLPLADVSDKAGETEESKKREKFCQPQDPGTYFANIRILNNF